MPDANPDYSEQSRNIMLQAETALRELLTEAAANGDYDAVAKIMAYAREVKRLVDGLANGAKMDGTVQATNQVYLDYPKFYRTSDNKLVMIGWSKKSRTEYEHKAPKSVLEQLSATLKEGSSNSEPVPIDKILQRLKSKSGSTLPEYFARTYLRWLRSIGLVAKHGHQGYSIKNPDNFDSVVSSHWKRLTTK